MNRVIQTSKLLVRSRMIALSLGIALVLQPSNVVAGNLEQQIIIDEVSKIVFNGSEVSTGGEEVYREALYNALVHSGLVTESMTHEQMCSVLSAKFPAKYSLVRNGWAYSKTNVKSDNATYSSNSSQVYIRSTNPSPKDNDDTDYNTVYYYDSPEFDITAFKTLSIKGSSYAEASRNGHEPYLYLVDANGVQTQLYKHPDYGNGAEYTAPMSFTKDVSSLKGLYRLRIYINQYTYYGAYIQSITLTEALLSA